MISNKSQYALRAVLELAKFEQKGLVSIGHIAEAQGIPARFLETIMRQLKQAGFVDATRGKAGGYLLARPAREILVSEVIEEIQGPLFEPSDGHAGTPRDVDVFEAVWGAARDAVQESMLEYRFDELARRELRAQAQPVADYAI